MWGTGLHHRHEVINLVAAGKGKRDCSRSACNTRGLLQDSGVGPVIEPIRLLNRLLSIFEFSCLRSNGTLLREVCGRDVVQQLRETIESLGRATGTKMCCIEVNFIADSRSLDGTVPPPCLPGPHTCFRDHGVLITAAPDCTSASKVSTLPKARSTKRDVQATDTSQAVAFCQDYDISLVQQASGILGHQEPTFHSHQT